MNYWIARQYSKVTKSERARSWLARDRLEGLELPGI